MTKVNFNRLHQPSGTVISGTEHPITVGDLRDAIAYLPDDAEITWSTCDHGVPLRFSRFKMRGENVLGIELNNVELDT